MPIGELAFHATRVAGIWQKYARPKVLGGVASVAAAAVLVASQFPAGGNDDSHITYWVAHALSARGRIENYNGLIVEQSSSLALVLLLGSLEWVTGLATPLLGWASGLFFGALTLALVALLSPGDSKPAAFWPPVLLGTWLPFSYWSTSGMETTLVTFTGCATVLAAGRLVESPARPRRSLVAVLALAAVGFVLVRPETPIELVSALALCSVALGVVPSKDERGTRRTRILRAGVLLASALALVLVVGLVRLHFFGLVVPNPAAAKSGAFALRAGAAYLGNGFLLAGPGLVLLALLGVITVLATVRARPLRATTVLLLGWGLSALAFVIASGGDWMPAARLLVPLGPALAIFAGEALVALARFHRVAAHGAGAVIVALNVASALSFGGSGANGSYRGTAAHEGRKRLLDREVVDFSFSELANRAHRRDARLLGPLFTLMRRLHPTEQAPITLMSGQAGMVPYYVFREFYGRARFIDLYALTTPEILPCIPSRHRDFKLQGVHISPGYVIDHADDLAAACGVERPHVVFSTGRCPSYLKKRGYECFYEGPRGMEAFVAVDRETLKRSRE